MMGRLCGYLPTRRLELFLTTSLAAAVAGLVWWNRQSEGSGLLVLLALDLLLPVALGMVAAGLLAGDPAIDLLLTVPRPASCTLAQRLAIVAGWGLLLAAALQGLAGLLEVPLPLDRVRRLLIWLPSIVLYVGVATAASLLRGALLDGVIAVVALSGGALMTIPLVEGACSRASSQGRCLALLFNPAATLVAPQDEIWPFSRLLWLGVGLLLLLAGLGLALREEALLRSTEEA